MYFLLNNIVNRIDWDAMFYRQAFTLALQMLNGRLEECKKVLFERFSTFSSFV
jgi:hypothetical protein